MSRASIDITSRQWPQRLRRREASEYLAAVHGIRLRPATLAKLACTGGGPRYRLDGHYPVYEPAELDAFAVSRLGPLRSSTRDYGSGEGSDAL
ncbi:MAG: hypothetical protein ACREH4_00770 [Vitreimonas sp.]